MSVFDQYNFELPRPIMIALKPVKELPPPFFVRVETQIYKVRKYFVQAQWVEKSQDTKTIHVFDNQVVLIRWDTSEDKVPNIIWKHVFSLDDQAKLIAFLVLMQGQYGTQLVNTGNFRQIVWSMLTLPLWQRIQYVEKVIS